MATSVGSGKRAQPGTHPTVFVGLGLAAAGLLLAMYAYTGTRIYDITFAYVAIGGGIVALLGILVSAWGRAIMASRAQRARRSAVRSAIERRAEPSAAAAADAEAPADSEAKPKRRFGFQERAESDEAPPTVAAPKEKRRLALAFRSRGKQDAERKPEGTVFSFRRRAATPSAAPEQPVVAHETPAPATERDVTSDGVSVRITLKCPRCSTEFAAEGVQPIAVECPSCGLAGKV